MNEQAWEASLAAGINQAISPQTATVEAMEGSMARAWQPFPDSPQLAALQSEADILFYGGAAGGGKTDLLIGAALLEHRRAIIFRREYPQLRSIIDRTLEILGHGKLGTFNGNKSTFTMYDGRQLELAGVPHVQNVERFQGRPHDYYGFDEVTGFLREQFTYLIGWMRTTAQGQRCRVIATGNPPMHPEGAWVIGYWAPWLDPQHPNPAEPGELRWFAQLDGEDVEVGGPEPIQHGDELVEPLSRTFIPARVEDNPIYMATGYKRVLQGLPEPMRSRLLFGDFGLEAQDDEWQVIPAAWVDAAMERSVGESPPWPMEVLGVDVSRGGRDDTVLSPRYGRGWFGEQIVVPGRQVPDGPTCAALVMMYWEPNVVVNIDLLSVGASPYDFLKQAGVPVEGIDFGAGSKGTDRSEMLRFANVRSECYWKLREALDPDRGEDLVLPKCPHLKADLCAARWTPSARGIQVEPKDDIKKRIGRSPDRGDSLLLAYSNQRQEQARVW